MRKSVQNTLDDDYAYACFLLEKKLGVDIHPDYSAIKFGAQLKQLKKYYDKQEQTVNKGNKGRGTLN